MYVSARERERESLLSCRLVCFVCLFFVVVVVVGFVVVVIGHGHDGQFRSVDKL